MILLGLFSGCSPDAGDRAGGRRGAAKTPAGARAVARGSVLPTELQRAILEECHRPLLRRMQRVKATATTSAGEQVLVQANLPELGRVREGRSEWLLRDGRVQSLDGDLAAPDQSKRVRDIITVVDAAAFGPLHRAQSCVQDGEAYTLRDGDQSVTMALYADTLLPASFTIEGVTITIEDYLHTPTSWVARGLRHPRLGLCRVVFEDGGIQFPPDYFTTTRDRDGTRAAIRAPIPGAVIETQSPTPIVVEGKATQLVLMPDPGEWSTRHEPYREVIEALQAQGQRVAGFPCIFVGDQHRGMLAAPFRRREGGPAFTPPADYVLGDIPAGRLLVVYPTGGDLDARVLAGKRLLARALANRKLTAQGPMIAQPFMHLHEAPPTAAKLAEAKVRVWVRIE